MPPVKRDEFKEYVKKMMKNLDEVSKRPVQVTVETPQQFTDALQRFDAYLSTGTIDRRLGDMGASLLEETRGLNARLVEQNRRGLDTFMVEWNTWKQAALLQVAQVRRSFEEQQALITSSLTNLAEQMAKLIQLRAAEINVPLRHSDYVSEQPEVVKNKPYERDILTALNRNGRYTSIVSDDGTVLLQFNGGDDIPLNATETFEIKVEHNFEIESVKIRTTSTTDLTCRVYVE